MDDSLIVKEFQPQADLEEEVLAFLFVHAYLGLQISEQIPLESILCHAENEPSVFEDLQQLDDAGMAEDFFHYIDFEENLLLRILAVDVRLFDAFDCHQSVGDSLHGQVHLAIGALSNELDDFVELQTRPRAFLLHSEQLGHQVGVVIFSSDVLVV